MSFQTSPYEAEQAAATANGHSAPASVIVNLQDHKAPGGRPRASRNLTWLRLSDDPNSDYAEHQIKVRLRYDDTIQREFNTGNPDRIRAGLREIVVEHNDWLDPETGLDLPAISEPCPIQTKLDAAIEKEKASLESELSHAHAENVRASLRADCDRAIRQLEIDASLERKKLGKPCCFWDRCDWNEIILMLRRINDARGKDFDSMLGTQPNSKSG